MIKIWVKYKKRSFKYPFNLTFNWLQKNYFLTSFDWIIRQVSPDWLLIVTITAGPQELFYVIIKFVSLEWMKELNRVTKKSEKLPLNYKKNSLRYNSTKWAVFPNTYSYTRVLLNSRRLLDLWWSLFWYSSTFLKWIEKNVILI